MARQRRKRSSSLGTALSRWLGYGVIFSLAPLGLHFVYLRLHAPLTVSLGMTLRATLARGDLFLLTCCLGGTALGERIGRNTVHPQIEIFLDLACQPSMVASVSETPVVSLY